MPTQDPEKKPSVLRQIRSEVLEKMIDFSTAAFGVVAALAWNDAIKAWISEYLTAGEGTGALFQYAVTVTALGVIITLIIAHAAARFGVKK